MVPDEVHDAVNWTNSKTIRRFSFFDAGKLTINIRGDGSDRLRADPRIAHAADFCRRHDPKIMSGGSNTVIFYAVKSSGQQPDSMDGSKAAAICRVWYVGDRDDNAETLIGQNGIGLFSMTSALADSLLIYAMTAIMAHFLMSFGQTLFHRYLGHGRLGGRFFENHIQFHHVHYAGDHVVSKTYLDDGDNNTLFLVFPVVWIVGLSYLFLRLDLFMVQFVAMSLSFCWHYYLDNEYHVAGSWLTRFSWFRRKQQLHFVHHRHANCNFAVIDFFWDRLLGTYRHVEAEWPVTSVISPRTRATGT